MASRCGDRRHHEDPSVFGSDKRKFIATLIAVFAIAAAIIALNVWNRGYF